MAERRVRQCTLPDKFVEDTYSRSIIPGPAGIIQNALRRKKNKDPISFNTQGEPIPTQEFLRIAVKNADGEDKDFYHDPWVAAVDYIRTAGLASHGIGTPLADIKSRDSGWSKVDQVRCISSDEDGDGDDDTCNEYSDSKNIASKKKRRTEAKSEMMLLDVVG